MRRTLLPMVVLVSALAQAEADDPLRRDDVTDELALAHVADDAGADGLARALDGEVPRDVALVAVRAAPHADAPELLVAKLAELARGRDPALAPEAAESLRAIFERLSPSELARREVLWADVKKGCEALAQEGADLRPDLALMVTVARDRCRTLVGADAKS